MADEDVLFKAALDISSIDPQIDNLKRKFEELSQTSLRFGNFNRSIRDMTTGINAASAAFDQFYTSVSRVLGSTAFAAKSATDAVRQQAAATKAAAQAELDLASATDKAARAATLRATAQARDERGRFVGYDPVKPISDAAMRRKMRDIETGDIHGRLIDNFAPINPMSDSAMRLDEERRANLNGDAARRQQMRQEAAERRFKSLSSSRSAVRSMQPTPVEYSSNADWRDEADADMRAFDANESKEAARRQSDLRRRRDSINQAGGASKFMASTGTSEASFRGLQQGIEAGGLSLKAFPSAIDNIYSSLGRVTKLWAEWALVTGVIEVAMHEISQSLRESSEYQTQSVLFQASQKVQARAEGRSTDNATPNGELMSDAISLASAYGEHVNDVAQDITLWKKSLGDLNASLFMTNEALKFQVATGTQTEDLYKTLTGLSAQANKIPLNTGDKRGFALDQTPKLLNEIYAAATYAGAGMHQLSDSGVEMHNHVNNAAVTLLEALDKDTAALGQMGYSMTDIIAINQGLITAFGNDGAAASEAADKIGRISGGLAGFGKPNSTILKAFSQQGIDLSGVLNTSVSKDGAGVLDRLSEKFDKLSTAQKNSLATAIGGNRQYEALFAILDGLSNKEQILQAIKKNGNALDETVIDMQATYGQSVNRMSAAWDGFLIVVGTGVLPMMTKLVQYVASSVIPSLLSLAGVLINLNWGNVAAAAAIGAVGGAVATGPFGIIPGAVIGGGADLIGQIAGGGGDENKLRLSLARSGALNSQGMTSQQWTIAQGPNLKKHPWVEQYPSMLAMQRPEDPLSVAQTMAWRSKNIVDIGLSDQSMKALMARAKAVQQGGSLIGPTTNGGKGNLKDYQIFGDETKDYTDTYKVLLSQQKDALTTNEASVESIKKHISQYGSSKESLTALTQAEKEYNSAIQTTIATLQKEEQGLQQRATSAKSHLKFDKNGRPILKTTADQGWFDKYSSAETGALDIHGQITGYQGTLVKNADDVLSAKHTGNKQTAEAANAIADAAYTALTTHLSKAKTWDTANSIRGQSNDAAYSEFYAKIKQNAGIYEGQDLIKADAEAAKELDTRLSESNQHMVALADEATRFSDEITKSTQAASYGILSDAARRSNNGRGDPHLENMIRLSQGLDSNKDQAHKDILAHPDQKAQIDLWKSVKDAQDAADYSLQEYEDHLKHLEDTPLFQGLTAVFKTLGDIIDKDLTNLVTGTDAATRAISALKDQIQQIQGKQSTDNFYYGGMTTHSAMDAGNQALANYNSQYQAGMLSRQLASQQYAQQNPSVLKQIFSSFLSTTLGSATSSLEQSGLGSIANALVPGLGGSTSVGTTQLTATQANTLALTTNTSALGKVSNGIMGVGSGGGGGGASGLLGLLGGAGSKLAGPLGVAGALAGAASGGGGSLLGGLLGGGAVAGGLLAVGGTAGGAALLSGGAGISGAGLGPILAAMGPVGWAALAAGVVGGAALSGQFGPHYSASNNPDMSQFESQTGYGQLFANAQGGTSVAGGQSYTEDPTMQQALGGMSQIQYLDQFVNSHPGGQGLTGDSLALWQQAAAATGTGTASGFTNLHNGNLTLSDASGGTVSQGNANDLLNNINNLTQSTYAFNSALNQSTSQMMTVINQYGGSSGFYPYAGATPGYGAPSNPSNPSNNALNPNGLPSNAPGANTGVIGAATSPITAQGTRPGSAVIQTSVNVDGRTLARVAQSYTAQSNNAGYAFVS